ncbi:MAG: M56 family metallopeptidase [Pirellula sp.]
MSFADLIDAIWQFAMLMLVQSTLLIAGVLIAMKLVRVCDAAIQSVVYRSTLFAVLIAPFVTFAMMHHEIRGLWPSRWSSRPITMSLESAVNLQQTNDLVRVDDEPFALVEAERVTVASPTIEVEVQPSSAPAILGALEIPSASRGTRELNLWGIAKTAVCFAWFTVSLVLLIRHWRAQQSLRKALSNAVPVDPSIQTLCDELASELRVHSPRVVCSPYFTSPFLSGVLEPVVHLSSDDTGVVCEDAGAGLREILIHELAHLKRGDLLVRLLNRIVLALFFFQPLLWRLVNWIENSAEDVCDDYAMSFGARRDRYAGRLVDLAERCDFPLSSAVGIASGKSMLTHRVRRIMDSSRNLSLRVRRRVLIVSGLVTLFAVICVGMLLTPAGALTAQTPATPTAPEPPSAAISQNAIAAQNPRVVPATAKAWPQDVIRGTTMGQSGPLAGAEVYWWRSRVYDFEPMDPVRVVTDKKGKFELQRTPPSPKDPAIWDMREQMVVRAKGRAFEQTWPLKFGASVPFDPDWPGKYDQPSEPVVLAAEGPSITGRLVDIEGQLIANASVRIRCFTKKWFKKNGGLVSSRPIDPEPDTQADLIRNVASLVNSIEQVPLRHALPMAKTDADGRFRLAELPSDCLFELLIERKGIQSTNLVVQNYGVNEIVIVPPAEGFEHNPPTKVYPTTFQAVIGPSVSVVGTVTDAETGNPIVGAMVQTNFVAGERMMSARERQHLSARTDDRGRYRINGLPVGGTKVVVFATGDAPYMPLRGDVDTANGKDIVDGKHTLDFRLMKGIWAEGRVFEPDTNEPFQGEISYFWFQNRELESTYPGSLFPSPDGHYFTDSDGRYRIPVLQTPGVIAFSTGNRDHKRMAVYSRGYGEFELAKYRDPSGNYPHYNTLPSFIMPGNYNRLALIDPNPNEGIVRVDMPLGKSKPIPVAILNSDGTPATNKMEIYGGNERWGWQDQSAQNFVVEDLLTDQRRKVFAFDRARNLVGGTIVDHSEGKRFEIKLAPAGSVRGRLLDSDRQPITKAAITFEYGDFQGDQTTGTWPNQVGKLYRPNDLTVDDDGRFEVLGLSSQWKYSARVESQDEKTMRRAIGRAFRELTISPGETRDLGDIVIKVE